jgi:hypothetical protein
MVKSVLVVILLLTLKIVDINAQEVVLKVNLQKGNAGKSVVKGGKFIKQGWQTQGKDDVITWDVPEGMGNNPGYFEVTVTNMDPLVQGEGKKNNQWFAIDERCEPKNEGVRVRIVTGKNYKDWFKVEYDSGTKKWDEPTPSPVLGGPPDPKKTYVWRASWDDSGIKLSVNGHVFFTRPEVPKGFCRIRIGEDHYPTREANIGVIYKSIKLVKSPGSLKQQK